MTDQDWRGEALPWERAPGAHESGAPARKEAAPTFAPPMDTAMESVFARDRQRMEQVTEPPPDRQPSPKRAEGDPVPTQMSAVFADDQHRVEAAAAETSDLDPATLFGSQPLFQPHPDQPETRRERRTRKATPKRVIAGAAAVLIVGAATATVAAHLGSDTERHGPAPTHRPVKIKMTRSTPPGWASTTSWTAPASIRSNVVVKDNTIAYLASSGSVVVLDGNGKLMSSSAPTQMGKGTTLGVATVAGRPVVVATGGGKALTWALTLTNPEESPTAVRVPAGAQVSWNGGGLLVSQGNKAWLPSSKSGLTAVQVPAGYSPIAATADETVVAAKPGAPWKLIRGRAKPTTVTPRKPVGIVGNMNPAWCSNGVLVAWGATKNPHWRIVAFYDVAKGTIKAQSRLATSDVNLGLDLTVNSNATLASAGPLLANLANGTTVTVPGWQSTSSDKYDLYGQATGGQVWSGSGRAKALSETAAIPWGSTSSDHAVVVDTDKSGKQLLAAVPRS